MHYFAWCSNPLQIKGLFTSGDCPLRPAARQNVRLLRRFMRRFFVGGLFANCRPLKVRVGYLPVVALSNFGAMTEPGLRNMARILGR